MQIFFYMQEIAENYIVGIRLWFVNMYFVFFVSSCHHFVSVIPLTSSNIAHFIHLPWNHFQELCLWYPLPKIPDFDWYYIIQKTCTSVLIGWKFKNVSIEPASPNYLLVCTNNICDSSTEIPYFIMIWQKQHGHHWQLFVIDSDWLKLKKKSSPQKLQIQKIYYMYKWCIWTSVERFLTVSTWRRMLKIHSRFLVKL